MSFMRYIYYIVWYAIRDDLDSEFLFRFDVYE
jgi:hypothetical protein